MHVSACTWGTWGFGFLKRNMSITSSNKKIDGKVLGEHRTGIKLYECFWTCMALSGKNDATSLTFCSELTSWYKVRERIRRVLEEGETWALCLTTSDGTRMRQATCKRTIHSESNSFCCLTLPIADTFKDYSKYRNLRNKEIFFVIELRSCLWAVYVFALSSVLSEHKAVLTEKWKYSWNF